MPEHVETHLLRAELLLQAEDFPSARRALNDTVEDDPTLRSLSLMAAIERGEGAADHVVRSWLNKALDAPRGAQWICGNCHNIAPRWAAFARIVAGLIGWIGRERNLIRTAQRMARIILWVSPRP